MNYSNSYGNSFNVFVLLGILLQDLYSVAVQNLLPLELSVMDGEVTHGAVTAMVEVMLRRYCGIYCILHVNNKMQIFDCLCNIYLFYTRCRYIAALFEFFNLC